MNAPPLDRAERLDQLAAGLDTWSPANDVVRGMSLLDDDFAASAGAARHASARLTTAAHGLHAAAEDLDSALHRLGGRWCGSAARRMASATTNAGTSATDDAAIFTRAAGLLDAYADTLATAASRCDAVTAALDHAGRTLAWTGPLPGTDALRGQATSALQEGAGVLRTVAQAESTLATGMGRLTGYPSAPGLPLLSTPAATAVPLIDDPPQGESGTTMRWGITTTVLNPRDTDRLVDIVHYGTYAKLGAELPEIGPVLSVVGDVASGVTKLVNAVRTPAGIRVDMVGPEVIAIRGR